jgi:hypothetical protein
MTGLNIDMESRKYHDALNIEANKYTSSLPYDGSAQAIAVKSAFMVGANTANQFEGAARLTAALRAGRVWALDDDKDTLTSEEWERLYRLASKHDAEAAKRLPMSEWGEARRDLMTPQTIAENARLHRAR